ncbi:hypothetical protein Scep_018797 [Stephania cephalantha]|uniref:Uncharacterized protein n=1 Tax=Stephania cephalantha TaxID=152367 RepID=A0AAP0NLJ8_9MAGN
MTQETVMEKALSMATMSASSSQSVPSSSQSIPAMAFAPTSGVDDEGTWNTINGAQI